MNIKKKIEIVKNLKNKLSSNCFYIIDSNGLKVKEINQFRRKCFEKKIFYKVIKNTLIKKALKELKYKEFDFKVLKGFSSILITDNTNSNLPAKIIDNFRKTNNTQKPILKIAFVGDELFIGNDSLVKLINIKSKNEIIYEIILLLKSLFYKVLDLLNSKKKIFKIIKQLKKN